MGSLSDLSQAPKPSSRPGQRGRSQRPLGQVTRGKTARNRLRRVDTFLLLYAHDILHRRDDHNTHALFVDVGYGAYPFTVLESRERFSQLNPHLHVLGVEIDPERVTAAAPFADERTFFRLGGFDLPLKPGESVRLIRAFNVLRQYEVTAVAEALITLGHFLLPGGLLIEGTSNPFGQVWTANLLRKKLDGTLKMEGLLFSTNFRQGFEPALFQPVLPKNFIHNMVEGEPIFDFFAAWKQAYWETIAFRSWGLRQHFVACALRLNETHPIHTRRKFLNRGYLLWKF